MNSMWPLLFTQPTKQPLLVRPEDRSITIGEGVLPSYHALVPDQPPPEQLKIAPYLADWQDKFDYVLVLLAGGADDLPRLRPDRLELVDRTDFAALFRVRPGPRLMSH